MIRYLMLALACAGLLALAPGHEARSEEKDSDKDTKEFFNGKDLTGWEGLDKYWSVKDGAIVGLTEEDPKHNTFLCSKKKYKDFELSFKIRLKDAVGNSGVQVRSKVLDDKKYTVGGPQCDIGQVYWGSLYGENFGGMMKQAPEALVKKALKPTDFNDYYIKCVGQHCTIKLNGETTVDDDFDKNWAEGKAGRKEMPEEGIIAWQLHAGFPSMEVIFKDIKFKNLSAK